MVFQVRTEKLGKVSSLDPAIWVLESATDRAEIWPSQGFNCYRWFAREKNLEILFADPQFLEGSSPTRTGIPILFPFPNRIRDGRFSWEGQEYQLPINDPAKKNAIHGFACRRAWRVLDQGADAHSAWVTGEFLGSRDAAECRTLWPADYQLRITYRLGSGKLSIETRVDNPDKKSLPFGLGFHHYFQVEEKESSVQVPARSYWDLQDCLPSGKCLPVDTRRNLNQPRAYQGLSLDDVLTDLSGPAGPEGMFFRGAVFRRHGVEVGMKTSPAFREAVVFTPPHRQAFCIEPYTCTTDAINLQQRGVEAGLLVLPPGQSWQSQIEMTWQHAK